MKRIVNPSKFPTAPLFSRLQNKIFEKPAHRLILYYMMGEYYPKEFLNGVRAAIPNILDTEFDNRFTPDMESIVPIKYKMELLNDLYIHNYRFNYGSENWMTDFSKYNVMYNPVDFTIMAYPLNKGTSISREKRQEQLEIQIIIDVGIDGQFTSVLDKTDSAPSKMIISFASPFLKPMELSDVQGRMIPEWKVSDFQLQLLKAQIKKIDKRWKGSGDS